METKKNNFISIYEKFEAIRYNLRPNIVLTEREKIQIQFYYKRIIKHSVERYSSSDIKRFFILVPEVWYEMNALDLVDLFKFIDTSIHPYNAFYGVFSFLFDIIKINMKNILLEEVYFTNIQIKNFIEDKKDLLINPPSQNSIDLKYIDLDKNIIKKIKQNLEWKNE